MDGGPIHGHSLFTGCLLEALTGGLARNACREATGSELGIYIRRRVTSYTESQQTPDFGALEFDHRGELIVPILSEPDGHDRVAATVPEVTALEEPEHDSASWQRYVARSGVNPLLLVALILAVVGTGMFFAWRYVLEQPTIDDADSAPVAAPANPAPPPPTAKVAPETPDPAPRRRRRRSHWRCRIRRTSRSRGRA